MNPQEEVARLTEKRNLLSNGEALGVWTFKDSHNLMKNQRLVQLMADQTEENRTEGKISANRKRTNPHE
jgi:hypothetical protein